MAFEDFKEQVQSELKNRWEQFQETSLYIQTRERYENLSPNAQKITLAGIATVLALILISFPWGYFSQSSQSIAGFEEKRSLIRQLLKSTRESQEAPNLPVPPDVNSLKNQVESQIQAARLLPEQKRAVTPMDEKTRLIPGNLSQGSLVISLAQLNLRQIIDLGHQFQSISPSVKMTDLDIQASAKDPHYFDVIYKLAVLSVPSQIEAAPEPETPAKKPRR
jgi:hypothetical protein